MGGVVKAVEGVVGGAVEAVGDAVDDVGDFVVDDIVKPVAKAVDNTLEAAQKDPIGTIAMVTTAIYAPYLLPAVSATNTLAKGGDLDDAVESAAKTFALQQAGAYVGGEAGAYATEAGATAEQAAIARGVASGATKSGLVGGDVGQGAIMGGLNAGTSLTAKEISDQNFEDWSQQQAAQYDDNMSWPTEQDVLASDPSIEMNFPLTTPTDATGPGYYDEMTGEYIESEYGQYPAPLDNTSGTASMDGYNYDPETKTWTTPDGQTYNMDYLESSGEAKSGSDLLEPSNGNWSEEGYQADLSKNQIEKGLNFVKNAVVAPMFEPDKTPQQQKLQQQRATQYGMQGIDPGIQWLSTEEQMLRNKMRNEDGTPVPDQEKVLASLSPELRDEFASRGIGTNILKSQTPAIKGMGFADTFAAGGTTASSKFCSTWGTMGEYAPKFYPVSGTGMLSGGGGKRQPPALAQLKHMYSGISQQGNMGGMAKGGLPSKYQEAAPEGHNPEFITGLTGYYACGGGTGQSDDITAMLHDGDYVMDAEAVSALGDGSSKAGRQILEGFRKKVPHKDDAGGKPVPAKIADGEYVFPAGFVTALGGGDNKAGAKILDGLREKLRAHKRSAPDSKIPPKAKSPLDYIKGSKG